MKSGRKSWTTKCGGDLLRRVQEAVDGNAVYAGDVYRQLNLQRFMRLSTFHHWVALRRRDHRKRMTGPQISQIAQTEEGRNDPSESASSAKSADNSPSVDDTINQCVAAISDALAAGRVGKLDVGKALRSLAELKQLSISEAANRRAEELHELKLVDLKSRLRTAVEAKSEGGAKSLTREDVYDLVDQIMRGDAA